MKVKIIKANGVQKKQDYFADVLKFDGSTFTLTTSGLELLYPSDWGTSTYGDGTSNDIFRSVSSSSSANDHAYINSSSS